MTKKVYDFSAKKKIWFLIPLILIVGIIVFTVIRGVEIAIEFKGGTIISYSSEVECDVNSVKKDIEELLDTPVTIQKGESLSGNADTFSISFSYDQGLSAEKQNSLTSLLQEKFPDAGIEQLECKSYLRSRVFYKMHNRFSSCRFAYYPVYCFQIQTDKRLVCGRMRGCRSCS